MKAVKRKKSACGLYPIDDRARTETPGLDAFRRADGGARPHAAMGADVIPRAAARDEMMEMIVRIDGVRLERFE